jgi:alkanesulfonate monooxygenase SsuD/methylene tetrahydromethanopterin reductase-like flavin-dependent oxidoreductase (luciferase family)
MQIIKPLLTNGHVDFHGTYFQAPNCEIKPRGPSASVPILLPGFGPRMLSLTVQYADLWNTAYLGAPASLDAPREKLIAACHEGGRDPATLGVTALVALWFPDLHAAKPGFAADPLTGSVTEIAAAMQEYAAKGVGHLMFHLAPYTPEARRRLTEALQVYQGMERQ